MRDTLPVVTKAISVRLDDQAERALRSLEATGLTRSEAIRSALLDAASRLRRRSAVAAEVAALEADEADREEMVAVADLMESSPRAALCASPIAVSVPPRHTETVLTAGAPVISRTTRTASKGPWNR